MKFFRFDPFTKTVSTDDIDDHREALKRAYGAEWFHDTNPAKAVLRAGGTLDDLSELEQDPEVLRARKARLEAEEVQLPTKEQIIMRLFEEGNYFGGSQSARVSALTNAAKLAGYVEENIKVKGEMTHKHKGGVMVVNATVPARDIDAWEMTAIDQQGQLPN